MKFSEQLHRIMQHYNLTTTTLADKISVPKATISHLMSERNKPSLEFIIKLHNNFPELNLHWLIHQEGTFLDNQDIIKTSTTLSENESNKVENNSDEIFVKKEFEIEENKLSFNSETIDSIVIFYKNGSFKQYKP